MLEPSGGVGAAPLIAGVVAAVLLIAAARMLARSRVHPLPPLVGAGAAAALALIADPSGDALRAALAALTAASAGAIVGGVAAVRLPHRGAAVLAAIVPALLLGPLASLQVAAVPPALELTVGTLDIGGTIARAGGPAAVVLGLLIVVRGRADGAAVARVGRGRAGGAAVLAALAIVAGSLSTEGAAQEATGSILVHLAIGAVIGAVSWMLVVRIAGRLIVALDPAVGALAGAGAVALGAALLSPVTATAVAAITGFTGGAFRGSRQPLRGAAAGVLGALAAGGIVLGLLADGVGLAATGSLTQAGAQLVGVVVVAVLGVAGGAAAGGLGRLVGFRKLPENDNSPGEPGL